MINKMIPRKFFIINPETCDILTNLFPLLVRDMIIENMDYKPKYFLRKIRIYSKKFYSDSHFLGREQMIIDNGFWIDRNYNKYLYNNDPDWVYIEKEVTIDQSAELYENYVKNYCLAHKRRYEYMLELKDKDDFFVIGNITDVHLAAGTLTREPNYFSWVNLRQRLNEQLLTLPNKRFGSFNSTIWLNVWIKTPEDYDLLLSYYKTLHDAKFHNNTIFSSNISNKARGRFMDNIKISENKIWLNRTINSIKVKLNQIEIRNII